MLFNQFLYYSVIAGWALNVYFLARFSLAWAQEEKRLAAPALALAAVCLPAFALTLLVTVRGGYDNDHDFMCLGSRVFTLDPGLLMKFKELSPLFTDSLSDLFGRYSLVSVVWKNRLLMGLSAIVFFAGLRRLGAGRGVSALASAFLFLNFLAPLNANSFSTTAPNIFVWLCALAAIFDLYRSPALNTGNLLWVSGSLVLLVAARFELLPAAVLVLGAALVSRTRADRAGLFRLRNLALAAALVCVLAAWTVHIAGFSPEKQLNRPSFPLATLCHQLGKRNFSVIAGADDNSLESFKVNYPRGFGVLKNPHTWAPLLFLALAAAGALSAGKAKFRRNIFLLAVLAAWILYFLFIYMPVDRYPLHFMRHQLYFLVPFAYLFALGLDGAADFLARRGAGPRALLAAGVLVMAVYAALNAAAAIRLNGERRTNDIELDFLMRARLSWDPACVAVYNAHDSRYPVLARFFPFETPRPGSPSACRLEYVSAYPKIFTYKGAAPLAPLPVPAARPGAPWRELSFIHAFYTTTSRGGGLWMETMDPLPLTIGFFKAGSPAKLSAAGEPRPPQAGPGDAGPFSRAQGVRRQLPAQNGENSPGNAKVKRVLKVLKSGFWKNSDLTVHVEPGERWRIYWRLDAADKRANAELRVRVDSGHNYQELIKEILPAESGVTGYMNVLDHTGGDYKIVPSAKKAGWTLEVQLLE